MQAESPHMALHDDLTEEDLDEEDGHQGAVMPLSQLPPAAQYMSASPRSCGCKARNAPSSPVVRSQQYNERLARARMQKNMATMQRRGVNTGACRRCQKAQSAVHLRSLDDHGPQNCATPRLLWVPSQGWSCLTGNWARRHSTPSLVRGLHETAQALMSSIKKLMR